MDTFLIALAEIWRWRRTWGLAMVAAPVVLVGMVLSQPALYRATATLQVDVAKVSSPLLQAMARPGQREVLEGILHDPNLLADTMRESGVAIHGKNLMLEVPNDQLLKISYASADRAGLESAVDTLAYNFIYELLSPERLRLEQRLASTGEQLRQIEKRLTEAADEGTKQSLTAQHAALQKSYGQVLDNLGAVNAAFEKGTPQAVIWFAESAKLQTPPSLWLQLLEALGRGLLLGAGFGLLAILVRRHFHKGMADAGQLARQTNLPVIAEVPNLGHVSVTPGHASVLAGATTLKPQDFTEITRLHRLATRGLKGAVVLTSAEGAEGTSLLAYLLALKSAQSGKKTLLIDLNLKNGGITTSQDLFGAPWRLAGRRTRDTLKDIIVPVGNESDNQLDVLPMPNDAETLEWLAQPGLAQEWMDSLKERYDHVWIDTTPISALNRQNVDALTLAAAAERTLLVVKMAATPADKIRQAAGALLASGAHVAGIVANNVQNPTRSQLLRECAQWLRPLMPKISQNIYSRSH